MNNIDNEEVIRSSEDESTLTISLVVRKLRSCEPFALVKINHGLWERLANLENLQAAGIVDPDELERQTGQRPDWADGGYLNDLRVALARIARYRSAFFFSATPYAFPSSRRLSGTPHVPRDNVVSLIARWTHANVLNADGLMWKAAVYDGSFATVIEALRHRTIVLVGPHWIRSFGVFAGFRAFTFFEIHASRARDTREEIYEGLREVCGGMIKPVIILSAGHMSPLIVTELLDDVPGATFLDMGVAVDICHIPTISHRHWAIVRRADVSATIKAIHPDWPEDERAFDAGTSQEERRAVWSKFSQGIDPRISETIGLLPRHSSPSELDRADLNVARVPFVEAKTPDWSRIAGICTMSQRADRWANFGPVAGGLASVLHKLMGIPDDRVVVSSSSATTALHAVVGAHAVRAGRPLIWAISAFGFPSTAIGPLAEHVRVVDCDLHGFIDLEQLAALEPNSWDGIILTNIFGNAADFGVYQAFCADRGKTLIIDSAVAFEGARGFTAGADEVVSFHHTKPWGFGEGGCAIVSEEIAQTVQNLLNFGFGITSGFHRYAMNGKMSDPAAAAILERLERMPSWSTFYRFQFGRINNLAIRAGVKFLGTSLSPILRGHVPVLAPNPITIEALPPVRFDVRKYYKPLAPGCPNSQQLYERILNVPCHPGMAAVPTDEIIDFFSTIASGNIA